MRLATLEIDSILARFPGPVTLDASRRKWALVLLGSALFAAGGVWMLVDGEAKGWFVFAVFGPGTIVAAVALLPGACALTLDQDGFETTTLFRRSRWDWRGVTGFNVISVPKTLVGFDHSGLNERRVAQLNAAVFGSSAALPDTYGLRSENLALLMALWRDRAMAGEHS